jgi:hypothetical protein
MALPGPDFGPVLAIAFARLASYFFSDVMIVTPSLARDLLDRY